MVDLTSRIIGAESSGNPFLRNPRSSAGGAGQFIDSTWLSTVKKHRPDLAAGKSDADLLRMKFDPTLSRDMTSAYAGDNQNFMRSRGIPVNDASTYLSHFAGPAGAAALYANPQASVEATLGPAAVRANPHLRGMTGQDAIDWAGNKMSPAQHQAADLRKRFGTATEGGATTMAPAATQATGTDRLKSALSKYDQDWIDTGKALQKRGQEIASSYGNKLGAYGGAGVAALGGFLEGMEGEEKKAHDAALADTLLKSGGARETVGTLLQSSNPEYRKAGVELLVKSQEAKPTKWIPLADGTGRMNEATGEVVRTGLDKPITKTEREKLADAAGLPEGSQKRKDFLLGTKSGTEKWNEGQSKAANFGNMMTKAEALIGGMGPKDASGKPQIGPDGQPIPAENPKGFFGAVRDSLMPFEGARNQMTPTDQQTYNQAAEQWIRAKLRKESGAAIGDEEMAKEFRTYFPQYGDSGAVIRQKADARAEATRGMIAESAGAYKHFFGGEKADEEGGNPDAPRPVKTQTIDPATGQPVPPGAAPIPGQPAGPPAGAIDKLTANPTPEMRQFFDQKYGAGAADRELSRRQSQTPTQDELQQSFGAGLY